MVTAENQDEFPQSRSQGVGQGFPVARVLAIISLPTGVVRDLAIGPYKGKETGDGAVAVPSSGTTRAHEEPMTADPNDRATARLTWLDLISGRRL